MYAKRRGLSTVETKRTDKATRNAGDIVATYQERTASLSGGFQTLPRHAMREENF